MRITVIGATGTVGRIFLKLLEERSFPYSELNLCASSKSLGKSLSVNNKSYKIEPVSAELLRKTDITFISATTEISNEIGLLAQSCGSTVIDDSSAFRLKPNVPLVVPEINVDDLYNHQGIISIPNCTTTPLAMVLNALSKYQSINRVIVDTYQSVSGTGKSAINELHQQHSQLTSNQTISDPQIYPHQIAFNLIPQIDVFTKNDYTKEEEKIINETRKILHNSNLPISSTCVRVPVIISHSEAVHIEFNKEISTKKIRELLLNHRGISILDDTKTNSYPTPLQTEGTNDVYVGRIRKDVSHKNGIALWIVCDNLRKGAALNAIQIAEELIERNLVKYTP